MQAVDPRVNFAELQQWPEDGRRYERAHGGLAFSIPIDIVFTKFDVLQPDVVYFLPENGEIATSPTRTGLTFNTRRLFEA